MSNWIYKARLYVGMALLFVIFVAVVAFIIWESWPLAGYTGVVVIGVFAVHWLLGPAIDYLIRDEPHHHGSMTTIADEPHRREGEYETNRPPSAGDAVGGGE